MFPTVGKFHKQFLEMLLYIVIIIIINEALFTRDFICT